jgi:SAM-dependent methyltransferase
MPPPFEPPADMHPQDAIREERIVMSLDSPSAAEPAAAVSFPVHVSGWVYSRIGIESVTISVDNIPVRARIHQPRPDVAVMLGEPTALNSGYASIVTEHTCAAGSHTVSVVAVDRHQHTVGVTREIWIEPVADDDRPHVPPERNSHVPVPNLDNGGERYVPELHEGAMIAAEHHSRYAWASSLAEGRHVLDAGCGVGWGTVELARGGARSVTGVDIDDIALMSARERSAGNAEFVRGDLAALPFADGSFDLVVSFDAIEHVADPSRALDEFRRVLRPGGVLAVSTPNRGIYPSGNPFHLHELSSGELEASLRSRFRNVLMYRQQTHVCSILTTDDGHAIDDPAVAIDASVRKVSGGEPGDELYTVALAGDSELPRMESVAVLGKSVQVKSFYEHIAALEQRALLADAEHAASRAQVAALMFERARVAEQLMAADRARATAERRLAAQHNSLSCRLSRQLSAAKRAVVRLRTRP